MIVRNIPVSYPQYSYRLFTAYVACIINSYYKSQLAVLDIIVRCHWATTDLPQDTNVDPSIWQEAQELALNITASIPYFLAENVQVFLSQALAADITVKTMIPGSSVGGLLSMHTLYMVSKMSVVDPALKIYLSDCLAWIGRNMGIGQATMLWKVNYMNATFD